MYLDRFSLCLLESSEISKSDPCSRPLLVAGGAVFSLLVKQQPASVMPPLVPLNRTVFYIL